MGASLSPHQRTTKRNATTHPAAAPKTMPATTEPMVAPPRLSLARRVQTLTGGIGMSTALVDSHSFMLTYRELLKEGQVSFLHVNAFTL